MKPIEEYGPRPKPTHDLNGKDGKCTSWCPNGRCSLLIGQGKCVNGGDYNKCPICLGHYTQPTVFNFQDVLLASKDVIEAFRALCPAKLQDDESRLRWVVDKQQQQQVLHPMSNTDKKEVEDATKREET